MRNTYSHMHIEVVAALGAKKTIHPSLQPRIPGEDHCVISSSSHPSNKNLFIFHSFLYLFSKKKAISAKLGNSSSLQNITILLLNFD